MYKYEVEEFAQYQVYEIVNDKVHTLCICNEFKAAKFIARTFASLDDTYGRYYVSGIHNPGDMIPGGGWHYCYHKNLLKQTVEEILD